MASIAALLYLIVFGSVIAYTAYTWLLQNASVSRVSTYAYPTAAHEHAPATITDYFATRDETDAVLLVCSCGTRQATPDSCLDMQGIVPTEVVVIARFSPMPGRYDVPAGVPECRPCARSSRSERSTSSTSGICG